MSEPLDATLPLNGSLDSYLQTKNSFVIYTHALRTRQIIAALFISYLAFLALFLRSLSSRLVEIQHLAPVFANLETSQNQYLLNYGIMIIALFIAVGFLFYFLWALVDIWGLQVWLSPIELRIENTITNAYFPRLMGIGSISMRNIEELRGSRFFTHVSGKQIKLRFSPVENVDTLIAAILSYAPDAKVID